MVEDHSSIAEARLSEMCTRPKKRQPLLVSTKMSRVLGFDGTYHDDHLAPCVKCWTIAIVLMIRWWFDGPIPKHRRRDCGLKFSLWNDLGSSFGLCSHERPGSYIFVRLVGWWIMISSYRENPHADMLTHALLVFRTDDNNIYHMKYHRGFSMFPKWHPGVIWVQQHMSLMWEYDVRGTSQLSCLTNQPTAGCRVNLSRMNLL